jgi:hypothetical protein
MYKLKVPATNQTFGQDWCQTSRLSKMHEVVPRAIKGARYPALLGKVCAFNKTDQNYTNLKAHTFSGQK